MASFQRMMPSSYTLSQIFPRASALRFELCHIISNSFETCTFRFVGFANSSDYPDIDDLVIRIQSGPCSLDVVATMQRLALLQLPEYVPPVMQVGHATTEEGTEIMYSVSPFCRDSVVLEEIWDSLRDDEQEHMVSAIVQAMAQLHKLDADSRQVQKSLKSNSAPTEFTDTLSSSLQRQTFGSHVQGFHVCIRDFLFGLIYKTQRPPHCILVETSEAITIESSFDDIGSVMISQPELETLLDSTVLCHNDVEPRNILVRQSISVGPDGKSKYELAAIIDWEMAGFFPFAYEYAMKDVYLGCNNTSWSWYSHFKKQVARLLPKGDCHGKFIKALCIIEDSRERGLTSIAGVRMKTRWKQRYNCTEHDPLRGWTLKDDASTVVPFSMEDEAKMKEEIRQELELERLASSA